MNRLQELEEREAPTIIGEFGDVANFDEFDLEETSASHLDKSGESVQHMIDCIVKGMEDLKINDPDEEVQDIFASSSFFREEQPRKRQCVRSASTFCSKRSAKKRKCEDDDANTSSAVPAKERLDEDFATNTAFREMNTAFREMEVDLVEQDDDAEQDGDGETWLDLGLDLDNECFFEDED